MARKGSLLSRAATAARPFGSAAAFAALTAVVTAVAATVVVGSPQAQQPGRQRVSAAEPQGHPTAAVATGKQPFRAVADTVCDGAGLAQGPRVCRRGDALLPNVFGGPATLGQCDFGNNTPGNSHEWGGGSCWSGSLFAFSGMDGQTSVASQFLGWFVNGSYSVHLWLPTKLRQLTLGFTSSPGPAAASDTVLVATNDALLVERGGGGGGAEPSSIAVTWLDWTTIVGEVRGSASMALEEEAPSACPYTNGCCGAVNRVLFASGAERSQAVLWNITQTYSGHGSTVCYVELEIDGEWVTDPTWQVNATAHANGPARSVLERGCDTFWNSAHDQEDAGPWLLTVTLPAPASVTGFGYAVYVTTEAPKAFAVSTKPAISLPWASAGSWGKLPSGSGNCTPAGPPTRSVNVSVSDRDALALATVATRLGGGERGSAVPVTTFALSYGANASEAAARAARVVAAVDVGATMQARNEFILGAPPMADPSDDRFQRKLLSVMKVNSLSPEGSIAHNWSTTCRAPHKWMYLWDGMFQTLSMNRVDPDLAVEYMRTFLQFQDVDGHMCSVIGPPDGRQGGSCSTDAMVPNVAVVAWDNHLQKPNPEFLAEAFPKLERYIEWDVANRAAPPVPGAAVPFRFALRWGSAGEAGMDHEQNFCPGNTWWENKCTTDHYALDFSCYVVYEAQALAKIAGAVGRPDRAAHWTAVAVNATREMDALFWDDKAGFYRDRWFNGTLQPMRTVAGFYPLMIEGDQLPPGRVERMVAALQSPDFWTEVPVPTVAVSTPDFSSDLDRGPMWQQQNVYIIRGLRLHGYNALADELKARSLSTVKGWYEKWGVVFEFYDALNQTDPTQTLRKPAHRDEGVCTAGVEGASGHCGIGGIREYNFCAGIALMWLRGGE